MKGWTMVGRDDDDPRSLFERSFAPYVAARWVRLAYTVWIGVTTLLSALVMLAGFGRSAAADVVSLTLIAPLLFLISLVSGRIFIKVILVIQGLLGRPVLAPAPARARSGRPLAR